MSALTPIRRYANADEGRIAWALLRSAGIEAVLDHHETCSMLGAVGDVVGVVLRVPLAQAEDSVAALAYVESGAFELPDSELAA